MARRDGRGPVGRGPLTGRCLGVCNDAYVDEISRPGFNNRKPMGAGRRRGPGQGNGRGMAYGPVGPNSEKDLLDQERKILKDRLNRIEDQLKNL